VPQQMLRFDPAQVRDQRRQWINRWLTALSH
jgi:ABC-type thiamine transport system substrate-binding protein